LVGQLRSLKDYDVENSRIVKAALKLLQLSHPDVVGSSIADEIVTRGTAIRPPCRFELVQAKGDNAPMVILDVAHNPPAMEYLLRKLQSTYPDTSFRIVVGMSSDKDMTLCGKSVMEIVKNDVSKIHFVQAAHPRAATLEEILNATKLEAAHFDLTDRSLTNQIQKALDLATRNQEMVVICGSVFLMSEAREALGFDEPRDSPYIAELAGSGVRYGQERFGNSSFSPSN
jgi:dihydrofolate synthase / folylpolyglutamate synthase